jgi:TfoX/Sxy family transcriptional regulator of competence genes
MQHYDPQQLLVRFDELGEQLPFVVTTRRMMSGYVAYADGKVFVSISRGGLGVKLTNDLHALAVSHPGARRMRHLEGQPESKTYVTFSDGDLEDDAFMLEWLTLAARLAQSAPKAKARKR